MRAAVLLIGVAGLAGCSRAPEPVPPAGPRVEDGRPTEAFEVAVANYLREARAAADALERSPSPDAADGHAKRIDALHKRLPDFPPESDRRVDLGVLLKRINEETALAATWVSKADKAARGGQTPEQAELAKKYADSLRDAVKAVRDRADQVEAILQPKK